MRKNYFAPQSEVTELKEQIELLADSDPGTGHSSSESSGFDHGSAKELNDFDEADETWE